MLNYTGIPQEIYTMSVQIRKESIMIDFINYLCLMPLELQLNIKRSFSGGRAIMLPSKYPSVFPSYIYSLVNVSP